MGRIVREARRGRLRRSLTGLVILAVVTMLLGALARLLVGTGWLDRVDTSFPGTPSDTVRSIAVGLSSITGSVAAAVLAALFALLLLVRRRAGEGFVQLGSGITAVIAQNLLREWVARVPPGESISPQTGSFPSSHVLFVVAVYGLFAYFLIRSLRAPGHKLMVGLVATLLVALVVWSRLILGTQYLGDVLAGLFLGSAWLAVGAWVAAGQQAERRGLSFRR